MKTSRIQQNELHIWWANLRDFDLVLPELWSVLSPMERERAERFRFLRDKDNFIIRHGMLRTLLGAYVEDLPSHLNFTIGLNGKPKLHTRFGKKEIHFNLSHSGDVALCGFTCACPIGVDVEFVHPVPDCEQIAREFFTPTEAVNLMALPEESRTNRFFDLWTRKEALVKATGAGLANDQVGLEAPGGDLRASDPVGSPWAFPTSNGWCVRSFTPVDGYTAAVAFQEINLNLIFRRATKLFSG